MSLLVTLLHTVANRSQSFQAADGSAGLPVRKAASIREAAGTAAQEKVPGTHFQSHHTLYDGNVAYIFDLLYFNFCYTFLSM